MRETGHRRHIRGSVHESRSADILVFLVDNELDAERKVSELAILTVISQKVILLAVFLDLVGVCNA